MELNERIEAFVYLGEVLREFLEGKGERNNPIQTLLEDSILKASATNPWFIREQIIHALSAWSVNLERGKLDAWLEPYASQFCTDTDGKEIAVIMAGNIPLVGFHDFLSVLISGNRFKGRLSPNDPHLLPAFARILARYNPILGNRISFTTGKLTDFDAVIATGSNNSANYFEYYFSKYPHIIRKNRNAVAILSGNETGEELSGLSDDIFLYFGMGCRNVTKLYLLQGYDFKPLFLAFRRYEHLIRHHKWMSNHDYYNSIFLLNGIPALDNGFILLTENNLITSPPAVLYYEFYDNLKELLEQLSKQQEEIQVAVSADPVMLPGCFPGQAQSPGLSDYADGIDTLQFMLNLPEKFQV